MNQKFETLPFPAAAGSAQRAGEFEREPERGGRAFRGGAYRAGSGGAKVGAGGKGGWGQWGQGGHQPGHQFGHQAGYSWPQHKPMHRLQQWPQHKPMHAPQPWPQQWPHHRPHHRAHYQTYDFPGLWPVVDMPVWHPPYCDCSQCGGAAPFDVLPFGAPADDPGLPFSADREQELAMELLSVSSEAEMEQFLGNVFSSVWKGVKKVASPLGGVLKAVAKRALPYVGGALGTLIPIPGVGTALGRAVGTVVSQALEMEFAGLAPHQQEFETARRFVRLAGTAAQLAGQSDGSPAAVRAAVLAAARRHVPALP